MNTFLYVFAVIGVFCLGFFVGRMTMKFDGLFIIDETSSDQKTRWVLDVHTNPDDIPNKKEIRLKVGKMTGGDV